MAVKHPKWRLFNQIEGCLVTAEKARPTAVVELVLPLNVSKITVEISN